jgi:beta-lactamase regulating signal transducer with metallopeptidase domain
MTLVLPTGPWAQTIGWALLHLVWQGALVAVVLALLLARLSGRSASSRYALSCGALALIVALGAATALRSRPATPTSATTASAPVPGLSLVALPSAPPILLPGLLPAPSDRLRSAVRVANDAIPVIVALWLVGVAFLSLRLILQWLRVRGLVARRASRAGERWQSAARRLAGALGVRRAVRLLESAAVDVPSVVGLVRPAILLPFSSLTGLTPEQLEMILAHELAHIRRHDFLVNLLQSVVETLLFYHPAVWWISRQIRIERENCCDDLAVAVCGDPVHYARALARLEELRAPGLSLAVSATGGSLLQRVRRLVGDSTRPAGHAVRGAAALAVLSLVLLGFAARSFSAVGQREPSSMRVELEAASRVPASMTSTADATAPSEATASPTTEAATAEVAASAGDEEPEVQEGEAESDPDVGDDGGDMPTLDELIALRVQGVTPEGVHQMRSLFPRVRFGDIATLAAVGATPAYIREMRSAGLEVKTAEDAQGLAALGVTRDYVRRMRAVGFPLRSAKDATSLKAVGVTPEYIREMLEAGVEFEQPSDAQSLAAVGVTPEFVRRLARAGYRNLTASELSRLGAAGITGDFIREMARYRTR